MTDPAAVTVEDVRAAQALLADVIRPTPLKYNRGLSERVGAEVYLKCENLQRAGSFKIRGAYTRMSRLSPEEKAAGVVAASAGNHAQGVALAGQMLGIKVKVYMPVRAPMPKVQATKAYGATIEQVGETLDESLVHAREWAAETGAVLIHPFDHVDIVAGQGTAGLEILDQCPGVRTVVIGLGGGGLLAGVAVVLRELAPHVRIIGVQAEQAAAYPGSLEAGHPVKVARMSTMADGIAVGLPGEVTFPLVRDLVDEVVTVSEAALARAQLFLLERAKLVVEPAGAAATAWLLDRTAGAGRDTSIARSDGRAEGSPDGRAGGSPDDGLDDGLEGPIVSILSGGNIDPLLMMRIIRYGMSAVGRYLQFSVVVPDSPGNLAALLADCAAADANVLEVEHVRTGTRILVDQVEIGLVLETRGPDHQQAVLAGLRDQGYDLRDVETEDAAPV